MRQAWKWLAWATAYFAVGLLSLRLLTFVDMQVAPVWAPAGIAVAAAIRLGRSGLAAVGMGAFAFNVIQAWERTDPLAAIAVAVGIAAGNTIEAAVAAHVVRRWADGKAVLDSPSHVLRFAFGAVVMAPAVAATIGALTLSAAGSTAGPLVLWGTWFLGDAGGIAVVAPLLLLDRPYVAKDQWGETAAALLAVLVVSVLVFGPSGPGGETTPLAYILLPALLWPALRLGRAATAASVFIVSATAIAGTLQGWGPFGAAPKNEAILMLQVVIIVTAATTMTAAARAPGTAPRAHLRTVGAAAVALVPLLVATAFAGIVVHEVQTDLRQQRIEEHAQRVQGALEQVLASEEAYMRAARGMFETAPSIDFEEFAGFVDASGWGDLSGIVATEFARIVSTENLSSYQRQVNRANPQDLPPFEVRQPGPGPLHVVVEYIAPFERNEAAYGLDLTSSEVRSRTVARALASPGVVASGPLTLVQYPEQGRGFLAMMSVSGPDGTPIGFIVSVHRMDSLVATVLERTPETRIAIRDRGPEGPVLYDDTTGPGTLRDVAVMDRNWTLLIQHPGPILTDQERLAPAFVLGSGALLSILLLALTLTLAATGRRAEALANKMTQELRQSNEELEHFAHAASHDLKAPLAIIHGYAELLDRRLHDDLDDKSQRHLAYIKQAASEMQQLLSDLLAYSRVGRMEPPLEHMDLGRVLEEVLRMFEDDLEDAEVHHHGLPSIIGVRSQVRELFQNLIENAIRYRHSERPLRIEVHGEAVGERVRVTVADNGTGFDPGEADKVFRMFQRLSKERRGSGMGLALCKKIVERHGGSIIAHGTPGVGATFTFTLAKRPTTARSVEEDTDAAPDGR